MTKREYFINEFERFDNFYLFDDVLLPYIEEKKKEANCKTYKDCLKDKPMYLSNVKINEIKRITQNTTFEDNPFIEFYEMGKEDIKELFEIFVKAEKNIRYYNDYANKMRDLKTRDNKNNISKKISDVMEYIEAIDKEVMEYLYSDNHHSKGNHNDRGIKAYNYLKYLKGGLSNNHFTRRQAYQDFLYRMNKFLDGKTDKSDKPFSKRKIVKIVNLIIEKYFEDDEYFTEKTQVSKFVKAKYIYETMAGIELYHGKK